MSTFKKITIEEQKKLSTDDQREYLKALMVSEGAEVPEDDGTFIVPSGGVDESDSPGALPPRTGEVVPPPGMQTEDHSDLPASMRGELGSLDDPNPVIPPVDDTDPGIAPEVEAPVVEGAEEPPTEEPTTEEPPVEEPPTEEPPVEPDEPYLKVNEQTTYKTEEEAIKGFDEKDRTIRIRDEEVRLAKQETELAVREAESLRTRLEAEAQAAEAPEPLPDAAPAELPPEPTAQQLYDIYDDPEKGPLEAFKQMMPHVLQDLQPLIDMAQRLKAMNADTYLKGLMDMKTGDVMQSYHEESIYSAIDTEYPEFEGKWRDPKDPVGKEYARIWGEIDQGYVKIHGASLSDISERSPESVQWAISEVLSRMSVPSDNGVKTPEPATTGKPAAPPEPTQTNGPDEGEPELRLTKAEAEALAKQTAEIAVKAVHAQNALHGKTLTEASGAKTPHPAAAKTTWTKEEIRKNPQGFAAFAKNNPNYSKATLDLLPQVRE